MLHHLGHRKPWLERMPADAYSRLLERALSGDGLTVNPPDGELPVRMRRGVGGRLVRRGLEVRDRVGWRVRERLPHSMVARIDSLRLRRRAGAR